MLPIFGKIFSRGIRVVRVFTQVHKLSNHNMRHKITEGLLFLKDLSIYIMLTAIIAYMLMNCK